MADRDGQRYLELPTGKTKMRLNDSHFSDSRQQAAKDRISVSRLINDLVLSLSDHFANGRIMVELDVQPLEAFADVNLIRAALKGLVRNALRSMPRGGELSVTLIDGSHQWEIEVADTSTNRLVEASIDKNQTLDAAKEIDPLALPWSQAVTEEDDLQPVYAAADAHGGHVQKWDCPSGGTANVLVIPKRHRNAA